MEALEVGTTGNIYQEMTCDFFEERGHPTIRTAPGTEQGYVHSLGHGLGLQIHSRPRLSAVSTDVIKPRQVLTIEPGLYYPDEGYGVRVEDTVFIDDSGEVHSLTPFPKDLVIEVG
ncbi:MAG TPA: M24 family metallopeptidase, partial [Aggregatilineales bacterium]|nr:M24 family metallopeptidase [Aggregatilineales bacterium]